MQSSRSGRAPTGRSSTTSRSKTSSSKTPTASSGRTSRTPTSRSSTSRTPTSRRVAGGGSSGGSAGAGGSSSLARTGSGIIAGAGRGSERRGSGTATTPKSTDSPKSKMRLKFTISDLVIGTTLGTGTFGRVRLVQHRSTKRFHALKILKKSEIVRLNQVDHIKSEVVILTMIKHPFIVNMLGHHQDERRLYMLLEYVPGGELFSHLRQQRRFPADTAKFYTAQIVMAFEHLHSFNIVYRDLKPENLLITKTGNIKITDFGFAKIVADRTWTLCGTPEYLAPEIIQSKGHGKSVDWWALGILIFEMVAGYPPFYDENPFAIYQKILAGGIHFTRHFDVKLKDLIRRLLTADKTKRLGCLRGGATDIRNHKWFARLNWDGLLKQQVTSPFVPKVRSDNDTSNFDEYPDSVEDTAKPLSTKDRARFVEFDKF